MNLISKIKSAITDRVSFISWKPETHNIKNSKCLEFNINPLCCYCGYKQYNTCLIECFRQNILTEEKIGVNPAFYIEYSIIDRVYGNYSKYMICAVEQFATKYKYIVDAYNVVYGL